MFPFSGEAPPTHQKQIIAYTAFGKFEHNSGRIVQWSESNFVFIVRLLVLIHPQISDPKNNDNIISGLAQPTAQLVMLPSQLNICSRLIRYMVQCQGWAAAFITRSGYLFITNIKMHRNIKVDWLLLLVFLNNKINLDTNYPIGDAWTWKTYFKVNSFPISNIPSN